MLQWFLYYGLVLDCATIFYFLELKVIEIWSNYVRYPLFEGLFFWWSTPIRIKVYQYGCIWMFIALKTVIQYDPSSGNPEMMGFILSLLSTFVPLLNYQQAPL